MNVVKSKSNVNMLATACNLSPKRLSIKFGIIKWYKQQIKRNLPKQRYHFLAANTKTEQINVING